MSNAYRRWREKKRPGGFRFSIVDALAIVICGVGTWLVWPLFGEVALLFPFVLFHFFLFCNIFRIPRTPELVWSAAFLLVAILWLSLGRFTWPAVACTQLPVTLAVLLWGIFRTDYHGVGYRLVPWGRRPERTGEDGAGEKE